MLIKPFGHRASGAPFTPTVKAVADVKLPTGFSADDRLVLAEKGRAAIASGRRADPMEVATMPRNTADRLAAIRETLDHPKIAVATDAFLQMHGVARTQNDLNAHIQTPALADWRLSWLTAFDFPNIGLKTPFHADKLNMCWATQDAVDRLFEQHRGVGLRVPMVRRHAFDRVHLNTEMSVGWAVKNYCLRHNIPHTSAYHTNWEEGLENFAPLLAKIGPVRDRVLESWVASFHRSSDAVLCVAAMRPKLEAMGVDPSKIIDWTHGVDRKSFSPTHRDPECYAGLKKPVALYVARCSPEKNIPMLMDLVKGGWPGSIVMIGDGPSLGEFRKKYPQITFLGRKTGDDLARHFASADVFIQPSRFETWGLTTCEALASGLPVVAVDHPAHHQILGGCEAGIIDEDLTRGALAMWERVKTPEGRAAMADIASRQVDKFSVELSVNTLLNAIPRPQGPRFIDLQGDLA